MPKARTTLLLAVICWPTFAAGATDLDEIPPPTREWVRTFVDTFDTQAPSRGLGDGLDGRQTGTLAPIPYAMLAGVWYETPAPPPDVVSVQNPGDDEDGVLLFHDAFSAVRLDRGFRLRHGGGNRVAFTVDPALFDTASLSWVSLVLTTDAASLGWVTDGANTLGLLIRSNGQLGLFSHQGDRPVNWDGPEPAPANTYRVDLDISILEEADGLTATVSGAVNGSRFTAILEQLPPDTLSKPSYVSLGCHYHDDGSPRLSSVDDLELGLWGWEEP